MDMGAFLHSPLMAELEALEKLRRPSVASVDGSVVSGPKDMHRASAHSSWGEGCTSDGVGSTVGSVGDASVGAAGGAVACDPSVKGANSAPCMDPGCDVPDSMEEEGGAAETAEKALHCPICLVSRDLLPRMLS